MVFSNSGLQFIKPWKQNLKTKLRIGRDTRCESELQALDINVEWEDLLQELLAFFKTLI